MLKWEEHVARMKDVINAYKMLTWKTWRKRHRCRWGG